MFSAREGYRESGILEVQPDVNLGKNGEWDVYIRSKRFWEAHCLENSRKHPLEVGFWREKTVFGICKEYGCIGGGV